MLFFFFQAEDGIRDLTVTGVQTCALPICPAGSALGGGAAAALVDLPIQASALDLGLQLLVGELLEPHGSTRCRPRDVGPGATAPRSEERRVGKECRSRGAGAGVRRRGWVE